MASWWLCREVMEPRGPQTGEGWERDTQSRSPVLAWACIPVSVGSRLEVPRPRKIVNRPPPLGASILLSKMKEVELYIYVYFKMPFIVAFSPTKKKKKKICDPLS